MTAKKPVTSTQATPVKKTAPATSTKPATAKPAATQSKPAASAAKPVAAAKPTASKPPVVVKPATVSAPKPASTPVAKAATPAVAVAKPAVVEAKALPAVTVPEEKAPKTRKQAAKKAKPVRDSFTFPEADYALIGALKQRALAAGHEVKKSEVLRAGLAVLNAMNDAELLKVLSRVERIKTGRPGK